MTSSGSNYTCECPLGFTGRHCDQLASACPADKNPCVNGGTCIQGPSGYLCACPAGDYDPKNNCERYTSCRQSPCANGGLCAATGFNSYKCTCRPGFSGSNCHINNDDCV